VRRGERRPASPADSADPTALLAHMGP